MDGKMVLLAFLGGKICDKFDMKPILKKRIQITGSTLRTRALEYKAKLVKDLWKDLGESITSGKVKPIIYKVLPWDKVVEAHKMMESNVNTGKIVLTIS
jgi:NADPH:quinone reductase-like Zn-dependent oxidoreductase